MSTEQTVEEFMRNFFARRAGNMRAWITKGAPFRAKYFTASYLARYQNESDKHWVSRSRGNEVIQSIRVILQSAEVVTIQPGHRADIVMRRHYLLQATEDSWQIERTGIECHLCGGTGQKDGGACRSCSGTGWRYPKAPAG